MTITRRRLNGVSALIQLPGENPEPNALAARCRRLEDLLRRAALFIDAFAVRTARGRAPEKLLAEIKVALRDGAQDTGERPTS